MSHWDIVDIHDLGYSPMYDLTACVSYYYGTTDVVAIQFKLNTILSLTSIASIIHWSMILPYLLVIIMILHWMLQSVLPPSGCSRHKYLFINPTMNSDIPECRRYPWLFIKNKDTPSDSKYYTYEYDVLNPFNHPNITYEDVITLIDLGYELSPDDRRDIAYNMHPSELFNLWDRVEVTLHISDLRYNPHIDNDTLEKLGRISRDPRDRRIQGGRTARVLSRCMDISEILKYPSLPWWRERLSKNESVTLEMIPLIEETLTKLRSHWDKEAMLDRSDPEVSLQYALNNPSCLPTVAKNNALSSDQVRRLIQAHTQRLTAFWANMASFINIEAIMDNIDIIPVEVYPVFREYMALNGSITKDNIEEVRQEFDLPIDWLYMDSDLHLFLERSELTTIQRHVLGSKPDILYYNIDPYILNKKCMLMNSDIDLLLDMVEKGAAWDLVNMDVIMTREDITPEQFLRILRVHPSYYGDEVIWLSPQDLLEIDPNISLDSEMLMRFRYATMDDIINFPQRINKLISIPPTNAVDLFNSGQYYLIHSMTKGLTLDIALRLGINSPVLTGIRDIIEFIEPYYYRREDLERITGRRRIEGIPKIYERLIRLGHWNVIRNSTKPMRITPHMYDITVICIN